ncbi:MAG: hypothetical protein WED07_03605 [Candidatus Freyarchaeum deiterrae]
MDETESINPIQMSLVTRSFLNSSNAEYLINPSKEEYYAFTSGCLWLQGGLEH